MDERVAKYLRFSIVLDHSALARGIVEKWAEAMNVRIVGIGGRKTQRKLWGIHEGVGWGAG